MNASWDLEAEKSGVNAYQSRQMVTILTFENLPILLLVAIYIGGGYLSQNLLNIDGMMRLRGSYEFLNRFAITFFMGFFAVQLALRLPHLREGRIGLVSIWKEMRERYFTFARLSGFLLIYAAIPPFMSTFRSFKEAIPQMQPFNWDEAFMRLDQVLHLGYHPWTLLQPLLGYPGITRAIDFWYIIWFFLLFAFPLWMAWSGRRRLRAQFFISFALTWIFLGTILAILFSSAGPCYYAKVTGATAAEDPFTPLVAYLDSVHATHSLWAVRNQMGLWEAYIEGIHLPFGGISAMPSLHVAAAILFALVGWNVSRRFGLVLAGYALVIQLGAVHLGWHYAIDGYLSAVLTLLIWKATDQGLRVLGWETADDGPALSRLPLKNPEC